MAELETKDASNGISQAKTLDDEQRVRVLSPSMLIIKRFFRNKLAMVGIFILVAMFLFSFLGGVVSPYGETEVFRTTEIALKDYAGATVNTEFRYTESEGSTLSPAASAQFILAVNNGEETFVSKDLEYTLVKDGEDFYRIFGLSEIASVSSVKGKVAFKESVEGSVSDAVKEACKKAIEAEQTSFEVDGATYSVYRDGKFYTLAQEKELAIASKKIFNTYSAETKLSYEFQYQAELAVNGKKTSFEADGVTYTAEYDADGENVVFYNADGIEYAGISNMLINAVGGNSFLSVDFKQAVAEAIAEEKDEFLYVNAETNEEETYKIERKNEQYTIRRYQEISVNSVFEAPSLKHLLGTDGNGMDILTRLMYGGRISLLIGFVVVIIEIVIGIIIGGVAGYFGKWIDNILMRLVEIVQCIPSMPLYIILGSIMDYYKLDGRIRIYMLCIILGILSWPAVARMVRGQILSLREQEFMIATEATGIKTHHRIFKHLIPNVIPQLIVIATMDLGSIILSEATLSFLGLGVKYPYASWGNIINAVNDIYVMTNYWFVWIPAGLLILLTVLGFNFVGDGLRDAFDPKMKR